MRFEAESVRCRQLDTAIAYRLLPGHEVILLQNVCKGKNRP